MRPDEYSIYMEYRESVRYSKVRCIIQILYISVNFKYTKQQKLNTPILIPNNNSQLIIKYSWIERSMRKSCHEQNRKMLEAYNIYQQGNLPQSLQIFQEILEKTSNPELRYNLLCTISIISSALGNHNYALQLLQYNLCETGPVSILIKIRYYANLCFLQIVMGVYDQAIYTFSQIKQLVLNETDDKQVCNILAFVFRLFFRVSSIQELSKDINVSADKNQTSLLQAFYILNLAIGKDICGYDGSQKLLKAVYPIFIHHNKLELALIAVRQLLLLPLCNKDITKYEKQLSKILSINPMQNYQLDNTQSLECCKIIAQDLIEFAKQIKLGRKQKMCGDNYKSESSTTLGRQSQIIDKDITHAQLQKRDISIWRLVLKHEQAKLKNNINIGEQQRNTIRKNIEMMLKQNNTLIISEMKKTDFYLASLKEIEKLISFITIARQIAVKTQLIYAFKRVHNYSNSHSYYRQNQNSNNVVKGNSINKMTRNKSQSTFRNQKQNRLPVTLVRDRSAKSLINQGKKLLNVNSSKDLFGNQTQSIVNQKTTSSFIHNLSHTNQNLSLNYDRSLNNQTLNLSHSIILQQKQQSKFIYKTIKFCQYGSFLNKRNFNSDGGQYRFIRVTQSVLKWAKNPQKIQESCKLYPLKDITSIIYGKCTPTLLKQSNHLLKQQYCFSLKLQKRTLDFYCKDFEQTTNWICGLSHKLKQINPSMRGYTYGRILWKRMFMLFREKYTDKLRQHERHFYYQTAHAIILFGKASGKDRVVQ